MSDEPRGPWRSGVRRGAMPLAAAALLAACGSPVVSPADSAESNAVTLQGPSDDEAAASGVHDGFHETVRTDRPRYSAGEEVIFTVETCNLGTPTTVEEGGPPFSFTIRNAAGRVVADDGHVLSTLALRGVSWAAGECREATGSWDQHSWNRDEDAPAEPREVWGLPNRGDKVPSGQYHVSISSLYGSATSEVFTLDLSGQG
jgi:hypothetical protein